MCFRTQAEIDAEPRFLECFKTFFEKAAGLTNLKPGTINNMKECNVVLRVEFPIKVRSVDSGEGWRGG